MALRHGHVTVEDTAIVYQSMQGADIQSTLDGLTEMANETQAELMAEVQ